MLFQTMPLLDDALSVQSSSHRIPPDNQLGLTPPSTLHATWPDADTPVETPAATELEDEPTGTWDAPDSWSKPPEQPHLGAGTILDEGPSQAALDRRVRRLMQPNSKGEYKVAEDVRKMWADGRKDQVFKLFAKCDNDPQTFVKRHSIKNEKEREREVGVFFKFLTEEEFKDKTETLSSYRCFCFNVKVY